MCGIFWYSLYLSNMFFSIFLRAVGFCLTQGHFGNSGETRNQIATKLAQGTLGFFFCFFLQNPSSIKP